MMRRWIEKHPWLLLSTALVILITVVFLHLYTIRTHQATSPRVLVTLAGLVFTSLLFGIFTFWWHTWRFFAEQTSTFASHDIDEIQEIMFKPYMAVQMLETKLGRLKARYVDLERISQLLIFFNYALDLDRQIRTALNLGHEILRLDAMLVFLQIEQRRFDYRIGTRRIEDRMADLSPHDALVEAARQRINALVDLDKLVETKFRCFTLPLKMADPDDEIAVFPISAWNRLVGLNVLILPRGNNMRTDDRNMATLFNRYLAIAIENHLLYHESLEKERLKIDVNVARRLQRDSIPTALPSFPGFDLFGLCNPCHEISGDYFDVVNLDDDRLLVAIADVSGKGLPAALFLSKIQTLVRAYAPQPGTTPASILNRIGTHLQQDQLGEYFATMQLVMLTRGRNEVVIASAGHCKPLLVRATNGYVEKHEAETGIPVGLFDTSHDPYLDFTIPLIPGDGILIYTDGITELVNPAREPLGLDRLRTTLEKGPHQRAKAMVYHVVGAMNQFKGEAPFEDDVTMVYIRLEADKKK